MMQRKAAHRGIVAVRSTRDMTFTNCHASLIYAATPEENVYFAMFKNYFHRKGIRKKMC